MPASTQDYHTPSDQKFSLLKRLHLPLAFSFYNQIVRIIIGGGIKAFFKAYDSPFWIKQSLATKRAIEQNGGRLHLTGLDHIKQVEGPVIFIGNHMSTLETFLLPHLIEPVKKHTFVIKRKLLDVPFFGAIMASRQPIVVDRTNPREDLKIVYSEGLEKIKQGTSLVIFPQSTRSVHFDPEQFNSLGVKLAKKAGVPVIPIALKTDFWGNAKVLRDFGPVGKSMDIYIHFGEPLSVSKTGKEEHNQIIDMITAHLKQWHHQP